MPPAVFLPAGGLVRGLGMKPLRTAWFSSMTVPEVPPRLRMPFHAATFSAAVA